MIEYLTEEINLVICRKEISHTLLEDNLEDVQDLFDKFCVGKGDNGH